MYVISNHRARPLAEFNELAEAVYAARMILQRDRYNLPFVYIHSSDGEFEVLLKFAPHAFRHARMAIETTADPNAIVPENVRDGLKCDRCDGSGYTVDGATGAVRTCSRCEGTGVKTLPK